MLLHQRVLTSAYTLQLSIISVSYSQLALATRRPSRKEFNKPRCTFHYLKDGYIPCYIIA